VSDVGLKRWLAVGLLLLVVAVVVFALLVPLVTAGIQNYDEKNDLLFRLQRQKTIAARESGVAENLAEVKQQFEDQGYFTTSSTEALASAELQNMVKKAVSEAGGQLSSTQGLPGKLEDGFFRVAVRVRMTASMETLSSVLHNIENAVPVLIIEQLDATPIRGVRNRTTNKVDTSLQLNISFQVVTFMRGQAQ